MGLLTALEDLKHRVRARIPLHIQDRLSLRRRARKIEARAKRDPEMLTIETGNDRRTESRDWYRGEHVNFMPSRTNLFEKNAIPDYVLKGWLPDKPFISKDHYITAFGSCFAAHVSDFLVGRGYRVFGTELRGDSYVIRCGEGMVNTYAVAQQFQWAYGEKEFDETLWFAENAEGASYGVTIPDETTR